jgi:hypothetical protein
VIWPAAAVVPHANDSGKNHFESTGRVKVRVEIDVDAHREENLQGARAAAASLTNRPQSIAIREVSKRRPCLVVEFTMKTAAQYKVVDRIFDEFKYAVPGYEDMSVTFPHADS